jgi:Methane oxygenase PmoA
MLPHPENPPQAWFTREYGIVVWNHVRQGPAILAPGEALRLRFRLLAHDGNPREADLAGQYAAYIKEGG